MQAAASKRLFFVLDKRKHRKPRRKHTLLFIFILVPLLIFTAPSIPETSFLHELFDPLGLFLIVMGVLGRSYSSLFVAGKKNGQVVKDGVYSVVRNPLYVFSFLGTVGIGLQSGRLTILGILILAFIVYYTWVVAKEEKYLANKFGQEFATYCANTPRWFPDFRKWSLPDTITVNPKMVQRTMTDALLFCTPLVVFELIEILQQNSIIKIYIHII